MRFKLSISIVTYKPDLAVLRATIDSALSSQTNPKLAIVDNGCEDRIQKFCANSNIEYIRPQKNLGYGGGHNLAIRYFHDQSQYHLILNPDVVIHSGCLEELVHLMDRDSQIILSTAKVLNPDGSIQRVHKRLPKLKILFGRRFFKRFFYSRWPDEFDKYELRDFDMQSPLVLPSVSGCFMFFRTDLLAKIGGFDERYFMYQEDIDLSRKASQTGLVVYWPAAVITHNWARGSHRKLKLTIMNIVSAIKYFLKWGLETKDHVVDYRD